MRHVVGTLRVEPMDATFGAVVHDVVLRDASDATIAELTELWLEYALLVFPGQFMTQDEQDEFARRFGDLEFTATPLTNIQRDGTLREPAHDLSKSLARQRAMAPRQHLHARPGEGCGVHGGDRH